MWGLPPLFPGPGLQAGRDWSEKQGLLALDLAGTHAQGLRSRHSPYPQTVPPSGFSFYPVPVFI